MTTKSTKGKIEGLTLKQMQDVFNKLVEANTCQTHKKELELYFIPMSMCPDCKEIVLPNKLAKLFKFNTLDEKH